MIYSDAMGTANSTAFCLLLELLPGAGSATAIDEFDVEPDVVVLLVIVAAAATVPLIFVPKPSPHPLSGLLLLTELVRELNDCFSSWDALMTFTCCCDLD